MNNGEQNDVEIIHNSGLLTWVDLSVTGATHMFPGRNLTEGDIFCERHEAADLRSQLLELRQSKSFSSPTQKLSSPMSNVTTVLVHPSKSDIPVITRWTSSALDIFNIFCHNHRSFSCIFMTHGKLWPIIFFSTQWKIFVKSLIWLVMRNVNL